MGPSIFFFIVVMIMLASPLNVYPKRHERQTTKTAKETAKGAERTPNGDGDTAEMVCTTLQELYCLTVARSGSGFVYKMYLFCISKWLN